MLAIQSSPSVYSFPQLPPPAHSYRRKNSMTVTPTVHSTPTSVFQALGSYADRIKDANGKPITVNASSSPKTTPPAMPSSSSSNGRTQKQANSSKVESKGESQRKEAPVEDGPWETVQSTRQRNRPEEKKSSANTSRNWRERPQKEAKDKEEDEGRRSGSKGQKKASGGSANSAASTKPSVASSSVAKTDKATPTPSSKPAWGKVNAVAADSETPSIAPAVAAPAAKSSAQSSKAESSSPRTNDRSGSVASPVPSAETASSVTAASSGFSGSKTEVEDEGSWRTRSNDKAAEAATAEPSTAPTPRPIAPPPAVNPWDMRKKTLVTPLVNGNPASSSNTGPVSSSQNATQTSKLPNGEVKHDDMSKVISKKKKKTSGEHIAPAVVADPSVWPDVAQAAEVAKKDEKKDRSKDKESKEVETTAVVDESGAGGKKMRWKSIPAAELQAAADRQAEHDRKIAAAKKRVVKGEHVGPVATIPLKPKTRKGSLEKPKAPLPSTAEIKLPPIPAKASLAMPFTPSYMTVPEASQVVDPKITQNGENDSAALSRTESKQSQHSHQSLSSPLQASTSLPSPSQFNVSESVNGKITGAPSAGQSPLPPVNGTHPVTRAPRGRDPRGSFSHRGRGGYRGMKGLVSPVMGPNGLPIENARAHGQHYHPTNSMGMAQYGGQAVYDPIQAQYALFQRGLAPPPPMPQTVVPNIDPQRFYILGQVEYYFSMQNLAMDFFLRQQMDTEGWIEISMIASFNRLRSLTPEVPVVKEVMLLSSLLEVRENKVRIAGPDSKRWVLPDAKISVFPPDPPSSNADSPAMMSQKESEISDIALETLSSLNGIAGLGMEDMNGQAIQMPKYLPGDVENALMKSVPPSSSASVLKGDAEGVMETPGTSMSGREGDEDEVGSVKVELR